MRTWKVYSRKMDRKGMRPVFTRKFLDMMKEHGIDIPGLEEAVIAGEIALARQKLDQELTREENA